LNLIINSFSIEPQHKESNMKSLRGYTFFAFLLVLVMGCGTLGTSSTPVPAIESTSTVAPSLPPTETPDTASPSPQFVWSFNGGETPFFYPSGIAIDSQNNLYIADTRNHRIVKIDSDGQFITQWGSAGEGQGQFISPTGVAVDTQDKVYVTEAGYNRVQKFDSEGKFLTQWGGSGGRDQSGYPTNIAVDGQGNVFITDAKNLRFQKLYGTGKKLAEWGGQGNEDGQFTAIGFVAVDAEGNVFVNDLESNKVTISKFDNAGNFLTKWSSLTCGFTRQAVSPAEIGGAGGMWFDPQGSLYTADLSWGRICIFDASGSFKGGWGEKGLQPGQLLAPTGIVGDNAGNIYVLDYSSGQVQKFSTK
ncbi:hypothetical protein HY772_02450, partial [Candidatus Woesearchaeota archaeon]|nr:hypothetical protein [Candidatus Woesearchaeota archaeon]